MEACFVGQVTRCKGYVVPFPPLTCSALPLLSIVSQPHLTFSSTAHHSHRSIKTAIARDQRDTSTLDETPLVHWSALTECPPVVTINSLILHIHPSMAIDYVSLLCTLRSAGREEIHRGPTFCRVTVLNHQDAQKNDTKLQIFIVHAKSP